MDMLPLPLGEIQRCSMYVWKGATVPCEFTSAIARSTAGSKWI
jgi:hypothetical protein